MDRREFFVFLSLGTVSSVAAKFGIVEAVVKSKNTLVYASHQIGSQLSTWGNLKPYHVGDIITIEGVHALDRITGELTTVLRQFVVTAEAKEDDRIINIYPPIQPFATRDYHPNVSASPRNKARIFIARRATVGRWTYDKNQRTLYWKELA